MVPELQLMPYEVRLQDLDLTILEDRRIRGDLIEMYKILHGFENIESNVFFKLGCYIGLCGNPLCLDIC